MARLVEGTVAAVIHAEVDGNCRRLLGEDVGGKSARAAGRCVAADARVQKGQVPMREPRRQIDLDDRRVLVLFGYAIAEEDDPVAAPKEERLCFGQRRPSPCQQDQGRDRAFCVPHDGSLKGISCCPKLFLTAPVNEFNHFVAEPCDQACADDPVGQDHPRLGRDLAVAVNEAASLPPIIS